MPTPTTSCATTAWCRARRCPAMWALAGFSRAPGIRSSETRFGPVGMLTALSIRDVVLIERLDLSFGPGLTVLTGETGAGKSILLDSLGLAMGARAEAGLVRAGAEQASVAAVFSPGMNH